MSDACEREGLLRAFFQDRRLAHRVIFRHRNATPDYINLMVDDFHRPPTQGVLTEAFRGGGKSTTIEEGTALQAGFREFRYRVIFGKSQARAIDRLKAIKNHLVNNADFIRVFGNLRGSIWADDFISIAAGTREIYLAALGRGQSLLGIKEIDDRPDSVILDDIEDREAVMTESLRSKTARWLFGDILPACEPDYKAFVIGTNRDPDDLLGRIKSEAKQGGSEWTVRTYPIEYKGAHGERIASWESRFPLDRIDRIRSKMERQGMGHEYRMEYMCDCQAAQDKTFTADMIRVEPRIRTWQAVYCMFDPARTVNQNSAATGFAAWSYVGPKIVVWDAWSKLLMSNEIVDAVFQEAESLRPVKLGVERDGLEEFLMQPIRQEMLKRGLVLPIAGMKAPVGKQGFIRGLQPFAQARELEFAKELIDLRGEMLSFPSGRIDSLNALAYALLMRPGAPFYEDFSVANIAEDISPSFGHPLYLVLNAGSTGTTAVLLQFHDGWLRIYADWVREGQPADVLPGLIPEIGLEARRTVRVVCPPIHFDRYNNFGLVQAANKAAVEMRSGTTPDRGQLQMREMLQRSVRGWPAVMVASGARWTLNAFSGGYARVLTKQGTLADYAEEGHYRVLMEGIESFTGLMSLGSDDEGKRNYRTRPDGTRYVSAFRGRST